MEALGRAASLAPPPSSRRPAPSPPTPLRTEGGKTRAPTGRRNRAPNSGLRPSDPIRPRPRLGRGSRMGRPRLRAHVRPPPRVCPHAGHTGHPGRGTRDPGQSVRVRPRAPILTGPRASLPSGPAAPGRPLLPA